MQYTSAVIALLASAGLAQAGVVKARADCQAQADACRVAPGANQSFCSAQLSSCLGYNPYANNTAAATTATTPIVRYTTVIQSSYVTYCPSPTTIVQGTQTYTVTAATTLTITNCPCTVTKAVPQATGVATPSTCVATCQAQYDTCRVGTPGMSGNQASCLAAFSQCLGFVPTNAAGQFTTPTACATSAASTRAATTAAATTAASGTCVQNCQAAYDTCRVGTPGMSGNQASCLAAFSQCLGFVPTNAAGQFTSPTACATSAASTSAATTAPAATTSAAANACVSSCQATYNTCRVGTPGMSGNQASCLAAYASCLGFLPTNAAGSLTSPTACSTTAAASTAAGRTSTVALTTTVRPAATVGVPVCQIGDGQIQNSGACTTVPGSSSTVVIPATTMTIPVVVSTTLVSTTAPVASVPVASTSAASSPAASSSAASSPATSNPATSVPATSVPATSVPATSVPVSSSTRTIQTVAASTTRPVTQFTGAASVEKPVYGLLAMGAFAALL